MKIVVDTNVFVSGIVFAGFPGIIIREWLKGKLALQVSLQILEEYNRVALDLGNRYKVEIGPFVERLAIEATIWNVQTFEATICSDPDDDKFLACALAS